MLVTLGESLTISGRRATRLRGSDDFIERAWIAAELQSSVGGVGAGDIQLIGGDALAVVEDFDGAFVVLAGVAKDVRNNNGVLVMRKTDTSREKVLYLEGITLSSVASFSTETRDLIAKHLN